MKSASDPHFLQTRETELKRELGLKEALAIVINRIIGSGIFKTPAPIMLIVGSVSLFYGVWIIGAVATILGAFLYAELVAMIPRSGGPYVFLKAAYPPVFTFLRGWAMFFVSETGAIAAVAIFFSETMWSLLYPEGKGSFSSLVIVSSILIVWLLSIVNSFGVRLSGKLQNLFSLLKIGVLSAVVIISFSTGFHAGNFSISGTTPAGFWGSILAIGAALRYSFFAYSGWEGATYVAEEVKKPSKNLPLSLFFGIGAVLLLYILINTAYINVLDPIGVAASEVVAVSSMEAVLGTAGAVFIAIAIMTSTFTNLNSQIMVKSRTWFAMARDGLFFRPLAFLHPKYKTPNGAIYGQAIWATVLVFFAGLRENAYEAVIDYFSFTSSVFNILTFAAVYVLRKKYPDLRRPYKAWGYPATLILVLVIQVSFMIITLIDAFWESLAGILLTMTGLLYWKFVVKRRDS